MKYLLVLFAMLLLFVSITSCSKGITEPTPEILSDGIAIVEAKILDADYPSWTVSFDDSDSPKKLKRPRADEIELKWKAKAYIFNDKKPKQPATIQKAKQQER